MSKSGVIKIERFLKGIRKDSSTLPYIDFILLAYFLTSLLIYIGLGAAHLSFYYIFAISVYIVLKLNRRSIFSLFIISNQELNKLSNPTKLIFIVLISNTFLVLFQGNFFLHHNINIELAVNSYSVIMFILVNPIRIFCEEFIFRGFLRIKYIDKNKVLFWTANIFQALLFGFIHYQFVIENPGKYLFLCYVVLLSIFMGWANRKYSSLTPSFLIHWLNGVQTILFVY
jgi:membrane protease YdiL (CAAX protease family)